MEPGPSNEQRRDWWIAAAIALLAWVLRYAYLQAAQAVPMFDGLIEDGESYGAWSDRLAAGDWLGKDVFYQAPLYPYFLGVVKAVFGSDLTSIRLVQITLGSLACALLFGAGRLFLSRRVGIAAGVLLALYPSAIFFDCCIQKANLGLLWGCALLFVLASLQRSPTKGRWIALGSVLGLQMLTREESLLLVPALGAWAWWAWRARPVSTRAMWLSCFVLGLALPLAPVAWRNHKVGGEWVLTTSQAGSNFYIGNGPQSNGTYVPLRPGRSNVAYERRDAIDLAQHELGRKLSPKEVSDFWFAKSFAWIRENPSAWLALMGTKLVLLLNAYEYPDAEDLYFYERYVPLLRGLNWILPWGVLASLGLAGLWCSRRQSAQLSSVWVVMATAAVGVLAFYVFARYRYTLVPGLALFAGIFVAEIFDAAKRREKSRWIALALSAVAVNWPIHSRDYQLHLSYSNAAVTLENRGQREQAIALFREALQVQPNNPLVLGNLGLTLERAGDYVQAEQCYRQVLRLRSNHVYDPLRLANLLITRGRGAETLELLAQAESQAQGDALAWRDLGTLHLQLRRYPDALRCLEHSLSLRADQSDARLRTAWLRAAAPIDALRDGARALQLCEELAQQGRRDLGLLEARAAALAELGRYADARATMDEAERVARETQTALPAGHAERRALYESGKPMRLPE